MAKAMHFLFLWNVNKTLKLQTVCKTLLIFIIFKCVFPITNIVYLSKYIDKNFTFSTKFVNDENLLLTNFVEKIMISLTN